MKNRRFLTRLNHFLMGSVMFLSIVLISGMIYQTAATEADQRNYPPPGNLVNVDGYKMHVYCLGEGSPTVILDSANMGTVSNWAWIQPEIAKTTRVCAYDRANSGWSDISPQPHDTRRNAEALHTLLQKSGVSGPYVLVGHSFGGLYTRMFAELYPDEAAGMVFIEGTLPDGLNRLGKADIMPNSPRAAMMDAAPFISRLGILRLMVFPATDPDLPKPQRSELQAFLSSTKWAEMIRRQYHLFPTLLEQVRPLYEAGSLGRMPVAVVLGSEGDGQIPEWRELFAAQAALSTNNTLVTVDGANHASLVDRQEHALQTSTIIRRVIEAVRLNESLQ
jgi:pimeloyl-ACP methyl ester carboxylesterase